MDSKTLLDVAEYLKAEGDKLAAVERLTKAMAPPGTQAPGTNIFGSGRAPAGPWDPAWPGYQSGDAWQAMLRRYAIDDGKGDANVYVRDRGLTPRWPDARQPWET